MLFKIIEIGRVFKSDEDYKNFAESIEHEKGIVLIFSHDPVEYLYARVDERPSDWSLLLFVNQKGNVSGRSCTVNLEIGIESKIAEKVERALEKLSDFFEGTELDVYREKIKERKSTIVEDIKERAVQLRQSGQRMAYLSVCVLKDGEELRPAHVEAFRNQFMKQVLRKMEETSEPGTCAFCGRHGRVSATVNEAFKFATFDKPGFCPSLRKQDATKVLPICGECMTYLKNGANKIAKSLSLDFLNVKLWIVPSLLQRNDRLLERIVKSIESTVEEYRDFARNEARIEHALSQIEERVFYDFVFVSIKQSQQRIELHLTQISPTRLKLLVDASKAVGERLILKENELPTVERMWHLYQKPSRRTLAGKEYFALVRSVFHGESYSYQRFLWHCMGALRRAAFSDEQKDKLRAIESFARQIFACVLYLNSVGVFNFREVKGDVNENFAERFFAKFPEFFNHPWKKAVFLTGVLTGKLLSIQYAKRQATPFFNKLKGLKMGIQDVQAIVPQLRNKLQQYGAFGNWAQELIRLIGHYFMLCGNCRVGIDEVNFVFTLGMAYSNDENFTVKEEENA